MLGTPKFRLIALGAAIIPAVVLAASIVGTPGPDVLEGTPDADTINGKGGADVMMGLHGNDTYFVAQIDDEVLEAPGDGTDTVKSTVTYRLPINVERLTLLGVAAINGSGNSLPNRLTGNSAANTLDGKLGDDTMTGLAGNDTYVVASAGDIVVEAVSEGTDTVQSSATYTLPANVELLVLTGTAAVNGAGNALANTITGNAGNNLLRGLKGNDTLRGGDGGDRLIGGPGNDKITTGTGQDIVEFDAAPDDAANLDQVVDFSPASDVVRLAGDAFPALSIAGTLPADQFKSGAVATTATHRILYDPGTGVARYDADGNGAAASVRFARFVNLPALTRADFEVVDPVVALVNYVAQIQPIFDDRCIGCHIGAIAPHGLRLDADNSYSRLVNVASHEVPDLLRVEPGDPDNSYLVQKVEGTAEVGGRMPLNQTPLTQGQITLIRRWISEGANP